MLNSVGSSVQWNGALKQPEEQHLCAAAIENDPAKQLADDYYAKKNCVKQETRLLMVAPSSIALERQ